MCYNKYVPTSSKTAIRPLLSRLGLDEREIEVYLALLSLKCARASAVAKAARQSRSHTYLILRDLIEKGLVSEVERGKIIHFIAEPPQRLIGYLEHQEQEIAQLKPLVEGALPLLQAMTSPLEGQPRVTMTHGMSGMKQLYKDILREGYSAFFDPAVMYEQFGENNVMLLINKHIDYRGRDLLVPGPAAERFVEEMQIYDGHEVRLLPEGIDFKTDIIIFSDTVCFFAYDDEQTIVRLQNKKIANGMLAIFEAMWSVSKEV